MLQLRDQHQIRMLGAFALGDVQHHAMEADDPSVLEDRLAARRDPALGAGIHSDDAILDVAHAIAFGIDALAERRLDAIAIFRMDPGEKDAEIDGCVGREAPHGLEARVPLDCLRQRV